MRMRMRILIVTLDNEIFVLRWRFASAASHLTPSLCKLEYAIKVTASMLSTKIRCEYLAIWVPFIENRNLIGMAYQNLPNVIQTVVCNSDQ